LYLFIAPFSQGGIAAIVTDENFDIFVTLIQSRYDGLFQKFQAFKRGYGNCYESLDKTLAPAMGVALCQAAADAELFD
jgi:hypothetical protein